MRTVDLSPAVAAQSLKQLVYTRAFVDEVLRLYPPAFLIVRVAKEADTILGHPVAPGTVVSISPLGHAQAPRPLARPRSNSTRAAFWPAPHRRSASPICPSEPAPRICVGAQFALTEAVLVLAKLMQSFRIDVAGDRGMRPIGRCHDPSRIARCRLFSRGGGLGPYSEASAAKAETPRRGAGVGARRRGRCAALAQVERGEFDRLILRGPSERAAFRAARDSARGWHRSTGEPPEAPRKYPQRRRAHSPDRTSCASEPRSDVTTQHPA